jgi:hypothetical protein
MPKPYNMTVTIRLTEAERDRLEEYALFYDQRVSTAARSLILLGLAREEQTAALRQANDERHRALLDAVKEPK